ncbi:MAG: hypothetical protein FWG64_05485 [Firmicutes bacterium]|nr:hypothetical protein [Bacillota bacterium]
MNKELWNNLQDANEPQNLLLLESEMFESLNLANKSQTNITDKKTLDKTIVDLKPTAHKTFAMLYLGARAKISKHITKSTLISMALESTCTGNPATLCDKTAKSHTFAQISQMGENVISEIFNKITSKNDVDFYNYINTLDFTIPKEPPITEETIRNLGLEILRKGLVNINLRYTDIENILNVILLSEKALKEKSSDSEETADGYVFAKETQQYTRYSDLHQIFWRYINLKNANLVYDELFTTFQKVLNHATQKLGYTSKPRQSGSETYYSALDENINFYNKFNELLETIELQPLFCEPKLYRNYKIAIWDKGTKIMQCTDCKPCIYDKRKCPNIWIKQHLSLLLKRLTFIDTEHLANEIVNPTFEFYLLKQKYPNMITFGRY